jgi:hypothetical protein
MRTTLLHGRYVWRQGDGFEGCPTDFKFRSHQAAHGFLRAQNNILCRINLAEAYIIEYDGIEKTGNGDYVIKQARITRVL